MQGTLTFLVPDPHASLCAPLASSACLHRTASTGDCRIPEPWQETASITLWPPGTCLKHRISSFSQGPSCLPSWLPSSLLSLSGDQVSWTLKEMERKGVRLQTSSWHPTPAAAVSTAVRSSKFQNPCSQDPRKETTLKNTNLT